MSVVDKRSVHTDALATLGSIIGANEKRDAIHIAVEPVVAAHPLRPGEDVGFVEGGAVGLSDNPVGIVDPFLKTTVKTGDHFWMLVYPRKITSLRHVWSHPEIPDIDNEEVDHNNGLKFASEKWMRDFVKYNDCPSYNTILSIASKGDFRGDNFHVGDEDAHGEIPPEFWDHLENITGRTFENRPTYFSCSC